MRAHGFKKQDWWNTKQASRIVKLSTKDVNCAIRKWVGRAEVGVYEFYKVLFTLPTPRRKGKAVPTYYPPVAAARAFEKYGCVVMSNKIYKI